jgi:CubicO group peptidase (beta-lactamase class C family)
MRSGLAFPVSHGDGRVTLGFENSAVYQDAGDAFAAAQRSIVATLPGAVYRYINSGLNVLGAIIRDQIERRGLPYHETLYGLLVDRLGMASYQHSAAIAGNLIASGAGFATLRDYAKLGVLSCRTACGTASGCCRRLGRLRADRDACRDQLCGVLPHQYRPPIPRSPARYRLGIGRLRPAYLHLAPPPDGRSGQQPDGPPDGSLGSQVAAALLARSVSSCSVSSPVAIRITLTALPITSAGRFSPRGPRSITASIHE